MWYHQIKYAHQDPCSKKLKYSELPKLDKNMQIWENW